MIDNEFRYQIDQIKQRVDIVEVIGRYVKLDRHHKARCPFHDDKYPSFSVNPREQYFYCFGCGKGGDVIQFLELYERKPFFQVLTELAQQVGIPFPQYSPEDRRKTEESRSIEDIRGVAAQFYHHQLTAQVTGYLINDRGFTDDTISRFLIGWAGGGLKKHLLEEHTFSLDLCLKAGVLKRSGDRTVRDFFYQRITLPNIRHGCVVHMTGRRLDDGEPKYLHLPGKIHYLYNEDDLHSDKIIVTEGIPDCLTAVQAGYAAVAVLGTSQFNETYEHRFSHCQSIYVCQDGDDAGKRGALKIGEAFPGKALLVELPDSTDLNEYLNEHSIDDFQRLLDDARPFMDVVISEIEALPENIRLQRIQALLPLLGKLDEFSRSLYRDVISKKFHISKPTIDVGISQGKKATDKESDCKHQPESQPKYTHEEEDAALELLKDPDLLERLIETTEKLGCVGEVNNKIIIFLTLLSRKLDDPISVIVKGDSSGGKSYLVDTVCRLFPREELKIFTTITPKALYHRTDDLSHKALIIFERPGTEDSDYSIRSLQSEKKLIISMSVKDPKSGRWVTEDHEIAGPIAHIVTTTESHLNNENETRCFEIFIDDSEQQTEKIHKVQKLKYSGESLKTSEDYSRPWIVAQYLLKPYRVIVPYIDLIRFPLKPLRARRDHARFLVLIEVITVLFQYQRRKTEINGTEYLIADVEDYAIAFDLASVILQQTIKQISPKAELLAHKVEELLKKDKATIFNRRQITQFTGWNTKTATKNLNECLEEGLIEIRSGGRGTAYEYSLVRLPDKYDNLLLHPDQLGEKIQSQQLSNLSTPIQNAIGQVNMLTDNKLDLPNQPNHENKDMRMKTKRKDADAN